MNRARPFSAGGIAPARQRGVALVVALVVLLILTIIGVSALVSTALEGMMAGNTQEQNRALQAAETGIDVAFATAGDFSLTQPVTRNVPVIGDYKAKASYTNSFQSFTKPPRSQTQVYSAIRFSAAHFQTDSIGTANIGATTRLTQGLYQITPKAE
jgi:Tfp pilus assembly protein PilX